MGVSIVELHKEFLKSCLEGDLNHVLQLAYYNTDVITSLLNGEYAAEMDAFPGDFQPGEYIHAATMLGHAELVAQLINLGADPSADSRYGTPSEVASKNDKLEVMRLLHMSGVDLHPENREIWDSGLFAACEKGYADIVQYILSSKPELMSHKTEGFLDGCILFYAACAKGHVNVAKILAEKGVDINTLVFNRDGSLTIPLDAACASGSYELIDYFLLQHAELPRTTIELYPHMFKPAFESMIKKLTRPASLRSLKSYDDCQKNFLSVLWDQKNLRGIHESWFSSHAAMISSMDLHKNKITELPPCFFELLPNLEDFDASLNLLSTLPERSLSTCRLSRLIVSKNNLLAVPLALFKNPHICRIDLYKNKLKYLPPEGISGDLETSFDSEDDVWSCTNLKILKLANNSLVKLPAAIRGASSLEKLNLSNNELISFAKPWNCPLEDLDLSGNQLESFDASIDRYWSKSLKRLCLAGNKITELSWSVCRLENLSALDLSRNLLERLPPCHYWSVKCLNKLNLSHNLLRANCGPSGFADVEKTNVETAILLGAEPSLACDCELPFEQLSNTLQTLDLSDNSLEMVPNTVCMLAALGELNLSNNPRIQRLPSELGRLRNIWNLKLDNLPLQNVPQDLRGPGGTKKILALLRVKLRKSVPFRRMKLMVVGLQGRGKTTLLATLQERKPPTENVATNGINVEQWTLQPATNQGLFNRMFGSQQAVAQEIIFSTWDLAGQHVYYATHQCFLTSNTLYLVVWNVEHGEEGLNRLAPWLLNIQARAPKSQAIIVGTHLDKLSTARRKEHLNKLEKEVFKKFGRKGFPSISGNVYVSNMTGEGLPKLREVIQRVAMKMHDSNLHEPMIGKMVPLSYLQLYDAVTKEAEKRASLNLPPILTADEFLHLAKENPDNDIYDTDELIHAAKFLHDHGILLHYNDNLRGLNNLYFIDPKWLCDMIALVVTVKEKNPYVRGGYIRDADVLSALRDPRLPHDFIPQYLQILERFEIALRLDEERILVPSMLPRERPAFHMENGQSFDENSSPKKMNRLSQLATLPRGKAGIQNVMTVDHIMRNYHLSYVPAGFWSRLIARLIIAVHKWGMIVTENEHQNDVKASTEGTKAGMKTSNYSMVYWREGILVNYKAGRFLVESFKDNFQSEESDYGNEGVAITVWSDYSDFSVMGFIVDQIDRLISEWYPGLEDLDEYGLMTVQRMIPCPSCVIKFKEERLPEYSLGACSSLDISAFLRNPEFVNQYSLTVCAVAALNYDEVQCSMHPDEPVLLTHLVPDLLLSDLPSSMVLDKEKLEFEASDVTRLGTGGAGEVYLAVYEGLPIAIKRFHSTNTSSHFSRSLHSSDFKEDSVSSSTMLYIPHEQTPTDLLEDGKVVRSFWELRQEVAVLCRLQHPCIVKLVGVCRMPLCFGLELAPKGGLYSILEAICQERDVILQDNPNTIPIMESVLGRKLTFNIALQVAHALLYLHDSEIVYRDLKSDNILVWSLDENDVINVKLSDYGISCFATPQGVIGEGGTPGFQAPEVKVGCAYNEKVDIFSFGIWMYELISGRRPLREHRTSAEIRKAVHSGVRPSLQNVNIDSKLPLLEILMQDCWVGEPDSRPPAIDVVRRMENPKFYCLCNTFPKPKQKPIDYVTCVLAVEGDMGDVQVSPDEAPSDIPSPLSGNKLLIWCGANKERRFVILDSETGTVQADIPCPGQRVLCGARVGQRIWLGTEGLQIEVFGRHCWQLPRVLWSFGTKDAVMSLLVEEVKGQVPQRVFASLANGTVLVFQRHSVGNYSNGNRKTYQFGDEEAFDFAIAMEKGEWSEQTVINLANEGRPAKSLVFTKDGKELWVASGNSIAIVDVPNLQLIQQIRVFTLPRHMITHLVSDGDRVWTIDRKSSIIYEWDVESRQKSFKFDCDISCNAKGVILGQAISDELFDDTVDSPFTPRKNAKALENIPEENKDETSNPESEQKDAPVNLLQVSSLLLKTVRKAEAQPSFLFSQKKRKIGKKVRKLHYDAEPATSTRPRAGAYSNSSMRLGTILLVGNTLWVGRSVGDILVINVRKPTTTSVTTSVQYSMKAANIPFVFGEVLCQLEDEFGKQSNLFKEMTHLTKIGKSHVVGALRIESKSDRMRERLSSYGTLKRDTSVEQMFDVFKLLVFEAWDLRHFEQFSGSLSALHALEC